MRRRRHGGAIPCGGSWVALISANDCRTLRTELWSENRGRHEATHPRLDRRRTDGLPHGQTPAGSGQRCDHLQPHPPQGRASREVGRQDRRYSRGSGGSGYRLLDGLHIGRPDLGHVRRKRPVYRRPSPETPDRMLQHFRGSVGAGAFARGEARRADARLPGQRQRQGREGGQAHHRHFRARGPPSTWPSLTWKPSAAA